MAMRVVTAQLLVLLVLLLSSATTARRPKKLKQVFETAAAFTPEECSQIVAAASAQPHETAVLHDGKGGKQRDVNSRDSTLTWLVRAPGAGTTNLSQQSSPTSSQPLLTQQRHSLTCRRSRLRWAGRGARLRAPLGPGAHGVAASTR
eukprot:COSAG03_NODE_94_length_13170_cov_67.181470_12_plen_147_part_00